MSAERDGLARWLTPEASQAQIERMWTQVAAGNGRTASRRWARATGVAVGALAAAAAIFFAWPRPALVQLGAPLSAEVQPLDARFSDGSHVTLAPEGSLELLTDTATEMRVGLASGAATFDVAKRPSRRFIVQARGVEVRVVGTRFTVRRDDDQVSVAVERGIVEVVAGEAHARLTAGQQWSSRTIAAAVPEQAEEHEAAPAPVVVAPPQLREVATPHRAFHRDPPRVRSAAPPRDTESAAQLLEAALAARREGRAADAALSLERLLRDHSDDPRAALAGFELGRLRMDSLNDLHGATDALELSMAVSPRAPFAEEALLRLVKAYDARGLSGACVHARDEYLTRFPSGPYVESVKGYCRQ